MKTRTTILSYFMMISCLINTNAKEIEVGFSTNSTALYIILNAISQAKQNINIAAYSFTNKTILLALLEAKKRGINIKVLVDKKANRNKYTAVGLLQKNQIETCLTDHYAIMHNKFMVIDNNIVQTGSFNYSLSAEKRNAENVILIYNKEVAEIYQQEFNRLYNECLMN